MKTTVVIDEKILEEAMKAANVKTKREAIEVALLELIRKKKRDGLMEALGTFKVDLTLEELEKLRSEP
ncbi:MAG: type II toxin-antitoxin system VapB family antitoxin [Chloroflexi bacterium]|nr:type II toxin-antitoxin system VapB family antitoxin [Chloroflexota bacterium]